MKSTSLLLLLACGLGVAAMAGCEKKPEGPSLETRVTALEYQMETQIKVNAQRQEFENAMTFLQVQETEFNMKVHPEYFKASK